MWFFATSIKGSSLIGFVFNNVLVSFLQQINNVSPSTCSSPLLSSLFSFFFFLFLVWLRKDWLVEFPLDCSSVSRDRLFAWMSFLDCSGLQELAWLRVQRFDLPEQKLDRTGISSGVREIRETKKTKGLIGCARLRFIVPTFTSIPL